MDHEKISFEKLLLLRINSKVQKRATAIKLNTSIQEIGKCCLNTSAVKTKMKLWFTLHY
jgi:hypothetical protein